MPRSIVIHFYSMALVCCFILVGTDLPSLYAESNKTLNDLKFRLSEAQAKLNHIDEIIKEYPSAKDSKSEIRSEIIREINHLKSEIEKLESKFRLPSPDPYPQPNDKQPVYYGNYHAIVIGNNDYKYLEPLNTAIHDAKEVNNLLGQKYGFKVTLLLNATRSDIFLAISKMRQELDFSDNLLIYYAGHGNLDKPVNRGYWLPVNAERNNKTNWVSNDDITTELNAIMAKHVLIVADSCFSGTLTRAPDLGSMRSGSLEEWVRRMAKRRSRTVLTSGALEPVLDAGGGDHSVFAQAFLGTLRENSKIIDMDTLYESIRRSVVVKAKQTPIYSDIRFTGHDDGDFIFVPH